MCIMRNMFLGPDVLSRHLLCDVVCLRPRMHSAHAYRIRTCDALRRGRRRRRSTFVPLMRAKKRVWVLLRLAPWPLRDWRFYFYFSALFGSARMQMTIRSAEARRGQSIPFEDIFRIAMHSCAYGENLFVRRRHIQYASHATSHLSRTIYLLLFAHEHDKKKSVIINWPFGLWFM